MTTLLDQAMDENNQQPVQNNVQENNESNKTLIEGEQKEVIQDNQSNQIDSKEATKEIEYSEFKLPEGMQLDESIKGDFVLAAKDLKLSQDQAQKLVDIQTKHVQKMNEEISNAFQKQVEDWKNETLQSIPTLKNDQPNIARALKEFGSPELRTLLNNTGLGNNKEVVNFLIKVGKNISDDKIIDGKKTMPELSLAERMYGKK